MAKPRAKTKQREPQMLPADYQIRPQDWAREIVRLSSERQTQGCFRRLADVQLWKNLTPEQQAAADAIYTGWSILIRGIGWRNGRFERIDAGHGGGTDREAQLRRNYIAWSRHCDRLGIEKDVAIYVLGYGMSLNEAARNVGKRKTWTSAQFYNGLTAYCDMRGWQMPKGGYIITTGPSEAKQEPVKYEPEKWRK